MLGVELPGGQLMRDMPLDTLYQMGTSPPSFGFLYSLQRLSLNPKFHGAQREQFSGGIAGNIGKSDAEQPLRSCLRILDKSSKSLPSYQGREYSDANVPIAAATQKTKMTASAVSTREVKVKPSKKVCFADTKGLRLHTVRIMDGPSDSPPRLSVNLLKDVIQDEQAEPSHPFTYVPDFDQPASNYLDFRERLEANHVCLENVMIRDNMTVVGTVKVRNMSFHKSVKIRVTFDEWKSFRDVPASYVFPSCNSGEEHGACASDKYDTFAFCFDLPPNLGGRAVYFCVCYECNQTTFWDNSKGLNYRIISLQEKETTEHDRMVNNYKSLSGQYPWTDVSFYNLADKERPYW